MVLRGRAVFLFTAVLLMVVRSAAPAAAADPRNQRDQARARQQHVRAQLNLATAADAQVEAEAGRLTQEATDQAARLDAAKSAADAANRQADLAGARLADTTARSDAARQALVNRVVDAYTRPFHQEAAVLSGSVNVSDLVVRQELLRAVNGRDSDALDAFRQSRIEQQAALRAVNQAKEQAQERTKAAAAQVATLAKAQADADAAHTELTRRISDLRQESVVLAAQEGSLEALIRAQDAQVQARLTQQAAERATTAPPPSNGSGTGRTPSRAAGPVSASGLIWPLHGPVTSEYGPRWGGFHPGIDIAPPYGTPIHAAKDGIVIFAGWNGGYGQFVIIDHGNGVSTGYAHQSQILVSQGQAVNQGQVIGDEGSTGDSTGPHLHFEVRINGSPQDPRSYVSGSP